MPTKVSKSKARARSVKVQAKLTTLRIAALALGSPARSRRDAIIDRLRAQHLRGEALERQVRRKARVAVPGIPEDSQVRTSALL